MNRFVPALLLLPLVLRAQEAAPPRARPVEPMPVPAAAAPDAYADRVTSSSLEFTVTGGTGPVRSSVASLAEETKRNLLRLADLRDEWKIPISIVLHGQPGDPSPARSVAFDLSFSETGFLLRLDLHLGRGIDQPRFQRALLEAMLYEHALRGKPPGKIDSPLNVPPWLVEGLLEAVDWRAERGDRRLYEGLFKSGGFYKLEDVFAMTREKHESLDGAMRAAFRVSSGALVLALIDQPQGKDGFRAFIREAASFGGEMPVLLRKHFPELNASEQSLAKWWQLKIANLVSARLTDVLSVAETEVALVDTLKLHFRDADGVFQVKPLDEWKLLLPMKDPERAEAVRPAQDGLVRLSYRCFPSHRPLIAEYQVILNDLVRNRTSKIDATLVKLGEARETMNARTQHARDYLDWFEITRARDTSGVFEDYMRLKERLDAAGDDPERRDPVSSYLDRMQKIYERPKPKNARPPGR